MFLILESLIDSRPPPITIVVLFKPSKQSEFTSLYLSIPAVSSLAYIWWEAVIVQLMHCVYRADWRLFLTVEERQLIRKKISTAYESRTQTYEELLQVILMLASGQPA